jgi:hypothetical protein
VTEPAVLEPARLDRRVARAWPRLTITLAAAGCGLIVFGVLAFGVADLGDGGLSGGASQLPGVMLSLGVPATLFFMTFDDSALPPFSIDLVLLGSTAAWVMSYVAGPGKGRLFYLGAALLGAWLTMLELVESVFSFPFSSIGGFFDELSGVSRGLGSTSSTLLPPFTVPGSPTVTIPGIPPTPIDLLPSRFTHVPDPGSICMLSVVFGIGYLITARALDRRGQAGRATPFTFAGIVALFVGIAVGFLGLELEASVAGAAFIVAGVLVATHGAGTARRGTTWAGGAAVFVGVVLIAGDAAGESARTFGIVAIVFGLGVVALAHVLARSTGEPADDAPGPSFGGLQPSGGSVHRPLPVEGGGDGLG